MATHSSVLAWRILWTEEPGGLLSIGSHRVGHDWSDLACMHALEKEMATHSSILAWRIPGMEEPGGLPSMGSPRVGHNWSDLAASGTFGVVVVEKGGWRRRWKGRKLSWQLQGLLWWAVHFCEHYKYSHVYTYYFIKEELCFQDVYSLTATKSHVNKEITILKKLMIFY